MCLSKSISVLILASLLSQGLLAQQSPVSNIRRKAIGTSMDTVRLDTLSIVPGSLSIPGIPDSTWRLDPVRALLVWKAKPKADSVYGSYRVLPFRLDRPSRLMLFDSVMGRFSLTPLTAPGRRTDNGRFDFGQMDYNGSLGRGLSFGNRQDVVLNSTLNLQLKGYLGDSILLTAAITDNNIPIQPDGNTQNLNEFDRVQVAFSKRNWRFGMGDIDIRQSPSYFLSFFKRLQGAVFETENRLAPGIVNRAMASGAVAKGKFTRNIFQGLEGNQGPYRLKGANEEPFFIVLAGTERVFIDGMLLQRGEDQDYVINYNTAEVTFTPRQMITKDKRIQIEFEYADRNFLNTQLYLADELRVRDRLTVRVSAFSNRDAKNSPVNQVLDPRQKQFLADLGDSVQNALYPSAVTDTLSEGKILYEKRDTLTPNGVRDTVFVYSRNPSRALYNLSFIERGEGRGDYVLDTDKGANGKVFKWVAPDPVSGIRRGRYEPAVLLVAPRTQQVFTMGADYRIGESTTVKADLAASRFDVNTLSSRDKGNDDGFAGKVSIDHRQRLGAEKGRILTASMGYEYVQASFRTAERLRSVEFYRDWGLPFNAEAADENLVKAGVGLQDAKDHRLDYQFGAFLRSNGYRALRHSIDHRAVWSGWRFQNSLFHTGISDARRNGVFFRPTIQADKSLTRWRGYRLGVNYSLEHNVMRDKAPDTISAESFSFDVLQLHLKSPENLPNRWGLTYFTRADRLPAGDRMARTDRSRNVNLSLELMGNEHHQLRLNATYRQLRILDDKLSLLKPDETVLARAEYNLQAWKGAVSGNVLYELGTGQEPRRDFTYFEVPAGQGEYAWIDYDNDGIQQLNEFERAQFRDQARFIRVFTPTSEFIKANYLQFNYSLVFNPRSAIQPSKAGGFMKILSRIYMQSSLQVNRKQEAEGLASFNPLVDPFGDTTLITLDRIFSNTFSYNRMSPVWGVDLNNIRTTGRAFLSYGYETRELDDWNLKARYNPGKTLTLQVTGRSAGIQLETPGFLNRNYHVRARSLEPKVTYTKGTVFRASAGYVRTYKSNVSGSEKSSSHAVNTECKYNVLSNTALSARLTFSDIDYNSQPNTAVSYMMLDGLLPGKNFLWTLDLTRRLSSFIELSVQYEGRKSGQSGMVHVGRAQVRALF